MSEIGPTITFPEDVQERVFIRGIIHGRGDGITHLQLAELKPDADGVTAEAKRLHKTLGTDALYSSDFIDLGDPEWKATLSQWVEARHGTIKWPD